MYYTPTSSSWLNVIVRCFRDNTHTLMRNGVFHGVPELIRAIRDFIDRHNANPTTFVWTKKAEAILAIEARSQASLDNIPTD